MAKRILLSLLALAALSVGVGLVTYVFINATLAPVQVGRIDTAPVYSYSITGVGKSALKGPLSAGASGDRVFVADSTNRKVAIFELSGAHITSFKPIPEVQTAYPIAIAADEERRIYVTVAVGAVNKIMVYNLSGDFLYAFPDGLVKGFGATAPLSKPVGLDIVRDRLYVTDVGDQDVKVFNLEGRLLKKIGGPGQAEGRFLYPNGVAADGFGNIYVSDSNNGRVQAFDRNGRHKFTFGSGAKNLMSLPKGIAVDELGRVHVVDSFNHKVLVFSPGGGLLFSYGEQGNAVDSFYYPNGLTIDGAGRIFIADRQNNRIAIWQTR